MTDDYGRRYLGEFQLQAVRLGAQYGVLALGGLIATHLVLQSQYSALGALLACAAALFAYVNFTIAANEPESLWVGRAQILSVMAGLMSGALVLVGAIG